MIIIYTLIKGGVIVNYDESKKCDILINDKIIENVSSDIDITSLEDVCVIQAEDRYVFPGFIDAHTHPGLPRELGFLKPTDDYSTETKAALMGGTTTICDFAEEKSVKLIESLNSKKRKYIGKANCKYTFHVSIFKYHEGLFEELREVKEQGINTVKVYTTYENKLSHEDILKVMDVCSKLDITVLVHCEEDSIINYCRKEEHYELQRPKEAEINMVNTVINFSKVTGCKVYICHVSSLESVRLIKEAKEQGINIYLETCPQYLIFDDSKYHIDIKERTKYILSPPFRKKDDNDVLIKACVMGLVDIISTDHCAFLYKEHKKRFYEDLSKVAKGIPGIQLRTSLMYDTLVVKNNMSVEKFVELLSFNPAKVLGLKDRGYLKEGMAADIVIWDDIDFLIKKENLYEGTDYSPYEGLKIKGKPLYVFIEGQKVDCI